ncbi:MAG: thioesterase family protein [Gordonia sp. (in: high G+C Gram-positive bacteria)]
MKQLTSSVVAETCAARPLDGGAFVAAIDRSWWGWSGPHGGVIAALVVHAASTMASDSTVLAVDLRFFGQANDEEITFTPHSPKGGSRTRVVEVIVAQGSREVAHASVTLGHVGPPSLADVHDVSTEAIRAPQDCARFMIPTELVSLGQHIDVRPTDGPLPLSGSTDAWMRAWVSTIAPIALDPAYLALLADCLPPAVFPVLTAPLAAPTIAFSIHFTAAHLDQAPKPVLVHTRNVSTSGGWSVDDTTLRDDSGRLLATARQSRRVLGWAA